VVLWRISNHPSLRETAPCGRPDAGTRAASVVYCAQSPAAALLEILVHFEIEIRILRTRLLNG
jgi:hypothetical protein